MKKTIFEEKKQDADFLSRVPEDSVYLMELFPESEFSIQDAIKLQKDYADPFIMNNMNGVIYLDILCNMRTKKQVRLRGDSGLIFIYYLKDFFEHTNLSIFFCKHFLQSFFFFSDKIYI